MSTTLNVATMVQMLQDKTGIGLSQAKCVDRLNEAFRKVNQMSKGGFIWQFKGPVTIAVPNTDTPINLPADFDPGKTAVLRSSSVTQTLIPYLPMKDFVNQQHFETNALGFFSAWTFYPSFTTSTAAYQYVMRLAPTSAFNPLLPSLNLWYHTVTVQPLSLAPPGQFFPTPDQFDSMIVDLAVAEVRNIYRISGDAQEYQTAMQSIMEIIDTYRTERYDLAGLTDQMAQAQEKAVEKDK